MHERGPPTTAVPVAGKPHARAMTVRSPVKTGRRRSPKSPRAAEVGRCSSPSRAHPANRVDDCSMTESAESGRRASATDEAHRVDSVTRSYRRRSSVSRHPANPAGRSVTSRSDTRTYRADRPVVVAGPTQPASQLGRRRVDCRFQPTSRSVVRFQPSRCTVSLRKWVEQLMHGS